MPDPINRLLAADVPPAVCLFEGDWLNIERADEYARPVEEVGARAGRFQLSGPLLAHPCGKLVV